MAMLCDVILFIAPLSAIALNKDIKCCSTNLKKKSQRSEMQNKVL